MLFSVLSFGENKTSGVSGECPQGVQEWQRMQATKDERYLWCVCMSEKRPGVCGCMWWLRRCLFKICVCWSSLEDQRVGMRDLHILTKEPECAGHEAGVVLSWY